MAIRSSGKANSVINRSDIQESLTALYLRLNGYFVSGFIVHAPHRNMTEMDVLAVRFPNYTEPEREVLCDRALDVPNDRIDLLVGEVKGGQRNANFNARFRENPQAIRAVLNRFGAFSDHQIGGLSDEIPALLAPKNIRATNSFPIKDLNEARTQLRFVLFVPDQVRDARAKGPYIFGDDLLSYSWHCFRPERRRPLCDVRYDYELWGPQFEKIVRFFKEPSHKTPGTIDQLYGWCGL